MDNQAEGRQRLLEREKEDRGTQGRGREWKWRRERKEKKAVERTRDMVIKR